MDSQALGATGASQKAKKPPAMLTAPRMAFADTLFDNQSCFGCGFHKRCGRELASPLGVVCQPGANVEQSGFEAGAVALAGDDQAVKEDSGEQGKQVTPPGGRTAPLSLAAGRMHQNGGAGASGGLCTPRPRRCRMAAPVLAAPTESAAAGRRRTMGCLSTGATASAITGRGG